jgi:uncharacterized protein (TIGR02271 family)
MKRTQKDLDTNKSCNPDPITKAPGSHPVGTGIGAAAGGMAGVAAGAATGAAMGGAAGPIGSGVGAAVGAVAGGLGGKAVAEKADPTRCELESYLDYTVVDRDDNKVGTVAAIWEDHTGQPAYVGVKTGWLGLGKAHVIPAQSVRVSEGTRKVRLPYAAEIVRNAPAFEEQAEIDDAAERRIADYYRGYGLERDATPERSPRNEFDGKERVSRTERDEVRVPVSEEHVKIGKREVESGGVRLRKIIRTDTVNQPVELQREEIVVERVPTKDRAPTRTDVAFREEEIYVPLRREEAVIEKYTETKEEVRVGKKRELDHRDIRETVRREDVEIERTDAKSNLREDQKRP